MTLKGTLVCDLRCFATAKRNEGCFRQLMFIAEGQVFISSLFYTEFLLGVGLMVRFFRKEETDRRSLSAFLFYPRELLTFNDTWLWRDSSLVRALTRKTRRPGFDPQLHCLNFFHSSVPMSVLSFFDWCVGIGLIDVLTQSGSAY